MKATELLMNEHRTILRALHILDAMAARAERGFSIADRDADDVLRILRTFVGEHHQGKEETILFPALLKDPAQENYAALSRMVFEHDQERSLVEGLEDSLRTRKGKDFAYYARRLTHVLKTHIDKEDRILFPLADAVLSPEEDARVARELDGHERAWKDRVLSALLERLQEMERIYLETSGGDSMPARIAGAPARSR